MRRLLMFVFCLFFILLFPTNTFADDFDLGGDSAGNAFGNTVTYSASQSKLPANNDGVENSIGYDVGKVGFESTESVVRYNYLENLVDGTYMLRGYRFADRVTLPPGAVFDVIFFYKNNTSHEVVVENIAIPFDNVSELVENSGTIQSRISTTFSSMGVVREGLFRQYPSRHVFVNGSSGYILLENLKVKNPISISNILATKKDETTINIKVNIKSNSIKTYANVSLEHLGVKTTFDLYSYEEKEISYDVPYTSDLGFLKIDNPNIVKECAVQGNNRGDWWKSTAISSYVLRSNGWVSGAYVQPEGESFCVEVLPYTMTSRKIFLEEEKVVGETVGDILGISDLKELPKAGISNIVVLSSLVVVDLFLWYSFFRLRRKYEDKDKNTNICTKSSKSLN